MEVGTDSLLLLQTNEFDILLYINLYYIYISLKFRAFLVMLIISFSFVFYAIKIVIVLIKRFQKLLQKNSGTIFLLKKIVKLSNAKITFIINKKLLFI